MLDLIGDNIWQTTGELPGPTLCVLGGVHGNELTGIEVVKRICADFASSARGLQSGRLIMAFGNPLAIEQGTRFVDGRDLNRYFTDTHLLGILDGSIEESRAKELAQVIQQSDITVDIHSTNKPSMPFISSRVDSEHLQVYQWFNASVVLADPNYVLAGEPATTDEYADRMGRVGVCVEAGDAKDVTRITSVLQSINGLMTHMGLVNEPGGEHFTGHQVFTLCDSIVLTSSGFVFAEGRGARSFESVLKGDVVGYAGKVPVLASADGVLVFPKLPEHQVLDKPLCYIAERTQ